MSLYDTLYSFAMILYGSIVSDDHEMTEEKRIRFMAVCKMVNLVASLIATRTGLFLFRVDDLYHMRCFLVVLVLVVMALSVVAQGLIHGKSVRFSFRNLVPRKGTKVEEASTTKRSGPVWTSTSTTSVQEVNIVKTTKPTMSQDSKS